LHFSGILHLNFETGEVILEATEPQQVIETANPVLPSGLPESLENDADFTLLIDAWPSLPSHIKQSILKLASADRHQQETHRL
jgi:hypothetical protein